MRLVGLLHIQKHTTSNTQSESVFDSGHTQAFCLNEKIRNTAVY